MVLVYTFGSVGAALGGCPAGMMLDTLGPRISQSFGGCLASTGLLLMALSDDKFDAMLPASFLIGFGGIFSLVCSFSVSFALPTRWRAIYLSSVNTFFDSSSVMFLLVFFLYKNTELSRRAILIGFAILCASLHGAIAILWSLGPINLLRAEQVSEKESVVGPDDNAIETPETPEAPPVVECVTPKSTTDAPVVECVTPKSKDTQMTLTSTTTTSSRPPLHGRSWKEQLKTFPFLFIVCFLPLQMLRSNAYLGTMKEFLQFLNDEDTGFMYTQIFAATMPTCTLFVPLFSWFINRRGFVDTYWLIMALGIGWNIVSFIHNLPLQIVGFVLFTNFRGVLYSTQAIYIAHTFGSRNMGKVLGIVSVLAGAITFLIIPMSAASDSADSQEGMFTRMYGILLGLCLPHLVLIGLLKVYISRKPLADCKLAPKGPSAEKETEFDPEKLSAEKAEAE